jgi:hypothetical protein
MAPTEDQRRDLAQRIQALRIQRFATKKDAYNEAQVNAATWTSAEAGNSLRPDRLRAIVKLLWPETGGDWRLIEPPLAELTIEDEIRNANLADQTKARVLRALEEQSQRDPDPEPEAERGAS